MAIKFNSISHWYIINLGNLFIFRKRGREGERGREILMWKKNIDRLPLAFTPARHQTLNPGMCPDWESNWWPFALWDDAQPTEPHQSGLNKCFLNISWHVHVICLLWPSEDKYIIKVPSLYFQDKLCLVIYYSLTR